MARSRFIVQFCFRQYGSSEASAKETGIVFFALNDLFEIANKRKDMISYEVHLQMVEICNEQLQDLLDEDSVSRGESSLSDVSLHSVKSAVDAVNLVKHRRTKCSSIAMNSSHSHRSVIQEPIYIRSICETWLICGSC